MEEHVGGAGLGIVEWIGGPGVWRLRYGRRGCVIVERLGHFTKASVREWGGLRLLNHNKLMKLPRNCGRAAPCCRIAAY